MKRVVHPIIARPVSGGLDDPRPLEAFLVKRLAALARRVLGRQRSQTTAVVNRGQSPWRVTLEQPQSMEPASHRQRSWPRLPSLTPGVKTSVICPHQPAVPLLH